MTSHIETLDQPEPIGKPLLGSVALHAAIFGTLILWGVAVTGPSRCLG